MVEFDLISHILSHCYLAESQSQMVEDKLRIPHTAKIIDSGIEEYMLYRFDPDIEDFLPFFEKGFVSKSGVKINPLTCLRKFCDYILIASKKDRLYAILVEMKSGDVGDAKEQLDASGAFFEFIVKTAERIKTANGFSDFDAGNIIIRKVILKADRTSKPLTNVASSAVHWHDSHIVYKSREFPIIRFCCLR